jgi:lauroyl/myristoyl acyltransferase
LAAAILVVLSLLKDAYRRVIWGPYREFCGQMPLGKELQSNRLLGRAIHSLSLKKRSRLKLNLQRALPGTTDFAALTRACFQTHFAEQYISWSFARIRPETTDAYLQIEGLSRLRALQEAGRGVVLVHPHMGLAQLPLCVLAHKGFSMHQVGGGGVAHTLSPRGQACEATRHALEEDLPAMIWDGGGYLRPLLRKLEQGEVVMCAMDGTGGGREMGRRIVQKVCGQAMYIPVGAAWLALQSGAALVPLHTHFVPGGASPYRSVIHDEIPLERKWKTADALNDASEKLAIILERLLLRHPGDWHFWDEFQPGRFLEASS